MTSGTLWQTEVAGRSYDELLGEYGMTPPTPPVTVTVRRMTLTGEETLAVDAVPGLEMLRVETGQLVAVDPAPPGTIAAPYAFEKGTAAQSNFRPGRVFRSADGAPATLLLMTITPAAAATPPPAA
jgi:hypothetical protein